MEANWQEMKKLRDALDDLRERVAKLESKPKKSSGSKSSSGSTSK